MSGDATAPTPYVVEDCRGALKLYSDGTISRTVPAALSSSHHHHHHHHHHSVDVLHKHLTTFHPLHRLPLRIYKPTTTTANNHIHNYNKLPILLYFHGGGFCIGSCTWPLFHHAYAALASAINAVVVAQDYRLAPEHRLPAAHEDAVEALEWVIGQAGAEEEGQRWWTEAADFGRVFVGGESAGGNLAHWLAMTIARKRRVEEMAPAGAVRVRGFLHVAPFFGGVERSASEAGGAVDSFLNLDQIDRYWRLSVPVGETRDHPCVNPFGPASPNLEPLSLEPIFVACGSKDLLKSRSEDYVNRLSNWGKKIEYKEIEGEQHGFLSFNPHSEGSVKLMDMIKHFIAENSN
ncbi:hypothetical protein Syun_008997 [Stephania yunnanensis]|uniref:Alpha/beta hydrolase fold-3 domain-containing protein n=1 Tax=Stephania yunnanensis TaxID=152371 RepID=A0AAP0KDN5_9MAGN